MRHKAFCLRDEVCSFNIRLDLAVRWGLFYFTLTRLLSYHLAVMWGKFSTGFAMTVNSAASVATLGC